MTTARAGKTFRVFVSSTFADLKAERDALQRHVFPRLRELCMQHGARFQAIDLRWGVSEEAGLDQQTMNLCLREVERCREVTPRPNFIVLLGERYGWRPLPPQIPADEFEALAGLVTDAADRELLQQWYRRDDNAVPSEYVLQPRSGDQTDPHTWSETETALRAVFARALDLAGWTADDPRRVKYEASATEQEVIAGALAAETQTDHAFCYFRTIPDMPQGDPATALFRDTDPDAARRLEAVKQRLREHFPAEQVYEYEAHWARRRPCRNHISALCERVAADLEGAILAELADLQEQSPLQQEIEAHRAFSEDRARHFLGRHELIEQIGAYLEGDVGQPLVVYGPSGCGKSALMAYCEQMARSKGAAVISRFVGATPASGDLRSLLESLCGELADAYEDERPAPTELRELIAHFQALLVLADPERPLVIFLDALDQLSSADAAHSLEWLPRELPSAVRLVVSVLERDDEAGACLRAAQAKLPPEWLVPITPLLPEEGEQLLDVWLREAQRTLQEGQITDVRAKFAGCPLPLFLKLAFEEARHWRSYDGLPCGGDPEPGVGRDIPGVIADLLVRLETPANHGAVIVGKSLAYLTAARNGLTEDEALDVLSADAEAMEDFRLRSPRSPNVGRLPVVVWARLFHDLEPYLTERMADGTSLMAFYHRQVGEAVRARYLTETTKPPAHRALARHFLGQPHHIEGPDGAQSPNLRQFAELPYQLTLGAMWDELLATLTDYPFLDAKLRGVNVRDLIADYERAGTAQPALPPDEVRSLRLIGDALRLSSHILIRDPDQLPSQLWGRLQGFDKTDVEALLKSVRMRIEQPWLRPVGPSLARPGQSLLYTMTGHSGAVKCVAVSADGKRAVSGGRDMTLRVWDLESGAELHTFTEHGSAVNAVALLQDGQTALSGSGDKTLRMWDTQTGRTHLVLSGHEWPVCGVAVTPDGLHAVSLGENRGHANEIKVWDLARGTQLHGCSDWFARDFLVLTSDGKRVMSGTYSWDLALGGVEHYIDAWFVSAMAIMPDGRRALVGGRSYLGIWDLEAARELHMLQDHTHATGVKAVAVSPDGRWGVSTKDMRIAVWDLNSRHEVQALRGHTGAVNALVVTPDSRRVISASEDGTLSIWNLGQPEPGLPRQCHGARVSAVAMTPDGKHTVSGSWDGTVKIWSNETGQELCTLEGYSGPVDAVTLTPDGSRAVSATHGRHSGRGLQTWDLRTGQEQWAVEPPDYLPRVVVTPDGQRIVAQGESNGIAVWDMATGQQSYASLMHYTYDRSVPVTPTGSEVVCGYRDGTLSVFDLRSGAEVRSMIGFGSGFANAVATTPDGRSAVRLFGNMLEVWELNVESVPRTFRTPSNMSFGAVRITPDGTRAVLGGDDYGRLWVLDLHTGEELLTPRGHSRRLNALAITADGLLAVSGAPERRLVVWDLQEGRPLTSFVCEGTIAHESAGCSDVQVIAVSPDGRTIACGDAGGAVHILRLENAAPAPPVCTAWVWTEQLAPYQPSEGHSPLRWIRFAKGILRWVAGAPTHPEPILSQRVSVAFGCLHCRVWSEVTEAALGTELPCPNCGKAVKLNEFVIEADWRPIAAAWKPEE